jgi:protein-tyrosine phosphatase
MVVVDWAMLENILSNYKMDERYLPYYILDYVEPPESITKFIKRQKPFADNLQGVAFDQVLNRELVDKYWKKKDS